MTSYEPLLFALVLIAMIVGLLGLTVPVFPGLFVIWLAAFIYGLITGFNTLGLVLFIFITLLTVAGSLVDNVLMGAKARESGAAWISITIGMVAGIVGSFVVPIIGGPVASLLGLFLAEYYRRRNRQEAWDTTRSMAIGCGWAFIARFGMGIVMIVLWLIWALA